VWFYYRPQTGHKEVQKNIWPGKTPFLRELSPSAFGISNPNAIIIDHLQWNQWFLGFGVEVHF
jgi:hypothetical protein